MAVKCYYHFNIIKMDSISVRQKIQGTLARDIKSNRGGTVSKSVLFLFHVFDSCMSLCAVVSLIIFG